MWAVVVPGPLKIDEAAPIMLSMYRCNACGEWVQKHLLFCPECRTPITPLDTHEAFRRSDWQMAALVALATIAVILVAIWAAS
ncbi:MAG TPA: hypothetical protein VKT80_02830 [Chloroflexota bacterium]|nr:hypothetical protein [Chloroflexota bacterium]